MKVEMVIPRTFIYTNHLLYSYWDVFSNWTKAQNLAQTHILIIFAHLLLYHIMS